MESKYVAGTPEIARFDYTHSSPTGVDRTQKRIELFAELLWNRGMGDHSIITPADPNAVPPVLEVKTTFADLTKVKKLKIVAEYIDRTIDEGARAQLDAKHTLEATIATDAEMDTDY